MHPTDNKSKNNVNNDEIATNNEPKIPSNINDTSNSPANSSVSNATDYVNNNNATNSYSYDNSDCKMNENESNEHKLLSDSVRHLLKMLVRRDKVVENE